MNFRKRFLITTFYGCVYGVLLASASGFAYWIRPFFKDGNVMALFFAAWYAIFSPVLAAILLGVPWLLCSALNGLFITFLLNRIAESSLLLIAAASLPFSILWVFGAYALYLHPLLTEQQTCDSICLGLENQVAFGMTVFHCILAAFITIGPVQAWLSSYYNRSK